MTCPICGKQHPRHLLQEAIEQHFNYKKYACADCSFRTHSLDEIAKHRKDKKHAIIEDGNLYMEMVAHVVTRDVATNETSHLEAEVKKKKATLQAALSAYERPSQKALLRSDSHVDDTPPPTPKKVKLAPASPASAPKTRSKSKARTRSVMPSGVTHASPQSMSCTESLMQAANVKKPPQEAAPNGRPLYTDPAIPALLPEASNLLGVAKKTYNTWNAEGDKTRKEELANKIRALEKCIADRGVVEVDFYRSMNQLRSCVTFAMEGILPESHGYLPEKVITPTKAHVDDTPPPTPKKVKLAPDSPASAPKTRSRSKVRTPSVLPSGVTRASPQAVSYTESLMQAANTKKPAQEAAPTGRPLYTDPAIPALLPEASNLLGYAKKTYNAWNADGDKARKEELANKINAMEKCIADRGVVEVDFYRSMNLLRSCVTFAMEGILPESHGYLPEKVITPTKARKESN